MSRGATQAAIECRKVKDLHPFNYQRLDVRQYVCSNYNEIKQFNHQSRYCQQGLFVTYT